MKIPENNQNEFEKFLKESENKVFYSIDSIADDIIRQKNNVMAMEFTKSIAELLRNNGVFIECYQTDFGTEINENMIYKKYGVLFGNVDFSEHDKEFLKEIDRLESENKSLKIEVSELQCEIQAMQVFPEEFPTTPIEVAQMLITASCKYETNSIQRALGAGETGIRDMYSISDLRQIAEHLLVYCNNNKDKGQ